MSKPTFKKSLLVLGLISVVTISAFFTESKEFVNRGKPTYNINYNDSTYDSKYILTPTTASELNSTTGSNYYIIVAAYETTSSIDNTPLTIANALFSQPRTISTITGFSYRFKFADVDTKSIDIRDLGADAGGAIFAYCSETIQYEEPSGSETVLQEETYNTLFSMANLQYLVASDSSTAGGFSLTNEVDVATSWAVDNMPDEDNVNAFRLRDVDTSSYLNLDGGNFDFNQSGANRTLYFYSISDSIARELSWSVCAHYMYWHSQDDPDSVTQDYLGGLYRNLPYFERATFQYRSEQSSSTYQSGTTYGDFNQACSLGLILYRDTFNYDSSRFKGPSVDTSVLTIDYSLGYITGFSPFEYYVSARTDATYQEAIDNGESDNDATGYTSFRVAIEKDRTVDYRCTEYYRKSRLYLIESDADFSFYGETVYLRYGRMDDYNSYGLGSVTEETFTIGANPAAGINLELKIATKNDLSGNPVQCIFDEEVQLTYTGDDGGYDYEYALLTGSLFYDSSQYYMGANLEKIVWQSSPIFNKCQDYNGLVAIGEEMDMVGLIRMAGDTPSPVIAMLENIMPANYEDGYMSRMKLLNDTLYTQYEEEHAETYEALSSNPEFETFTLSSLHSDAETEIDNITSRDVAKASNTLANQVKLEMAYEVTAHMHDRIAEELIDSYSDNQTTRCANINEQLMSELYSYTVDLTNDLETELEALDNLIDSYQAQITDSLALDNLCKQFITAFNNAIAAHPEYRNELWDMFNSAIDSIYNASSLEDAQDAYDLAIEQINDIITEEDDG